MWNYLFIYFFTPKWYFKFMYLGELTLWDLLTTRRHWVNRLEDTREIPVSHIIRLYEAINAFIVLEGSVKCVMHITTNEVHVLIIIIKCLRQSPINVQKGSQCLRCAFMEEFPSNLKHSGCNSVCIYSSLHKNLAQAFISRLHSKMKSE